MALTIRGGQGDRRRDLPARASTVAGLTVLGLLAVASSHAFDAARQVVAADSSDSTSGPVALPPDISNRPGTDWPRFLGPNLDGRSPEIGVRREWGENGLPIVWQMEVGSGYATPVVERGRLFLFDRHGNASRLTCLEAESGKELWRSEYEMQYQDAFGFGNGPRAGPVVDGDLVYTFGVAGRLRAHRVVDGALVWEVDTAERFGVIQNFFGVGSTPFVEKDLLLVMVGGSPGDSPPLDSGNVQSAGSALAAFDKRTGELRYSSGDELASYSSPLVYTIVGHRRGLAFARGGLLGFDPATGRVDFHFPWRSQKLYSVNAATPVVSGSSVFLTESYGPGGVLLRLTGDDHKVVWKDSPRQISLASHWATPVLHDGVLYGSSGEKAGSAELKAVDFDTGEVRWSHRGLGRVTLSWIDGHLLVLNERGRLALVEARPDRLEIVTEMSLEEELGYPSWNAPVVARGLLYVLGAKRLLALELIPHP